MRPFRLSFEFVKIIKLAKRDGISFEYYCNKNHPHFPLWDFSSNKNMLGTHIQITFEGTLLVSLQHSLTI